MTSLKLSIVVICWNDLRDLGNCLQSIYQETPALDFEVILTDNGSTDGSVAFVRESFPNVRIVENGANLGFGPGNNRGIRAAQGEYVLILNPDTIVRDHALEKLVAFADRHPEAGAFGCRVLNVDGSLQRTAQPRPSAWRYFIGAIGLARFGKISEALDSDQYAGWDGRSERAIGFHAGCCLLARRRLLSQLDGFDERFFHQFEDADLCHRIWASGNSVLFCPEAEITHIGGESRGRYPIKVVLETQRSKYRYFHKHYGRKGAKRIRWISLTGLGLRYVGYRLLSLFKSGQGLESRLEMLRVLLRWHWRLDPIQFVESGEEPHLGYPPLAIPMSSDSSRTSAFERCDRKSLTL